jgi:thioredoxin
LGLNNATFATLTLAIELAISANLIDNAKRLDLRRRLMAVKQQFASFEDAIANSDRPILVDFYATWCGPCQMMAKILEQVNLQLNAQIQIIKIDTDRYPQIASQHQIQALPTLVLFKNGQPVDRIEGVLQAPQLVDRVRQFL